VKLILNTHLYLKAHFKLNAQLNQNLVMQELGLEIWSQALSLAEGRLDAERQSLQEARAETEAARNEAAELADQVSLELDDARKSMVALTQERASLQEGVIEQLKDQLAKALERAAHAEARATEVTHRAEDLNTQLTRVNAQNSDLIQALAQRGAGGQTEKAQV
jgi:chromosome segregation ATPase